MKIIYIDIETTGIPVPESGLIQLAGAIEIDGEVREQFDYLVKPFPQDVICDEALTVNGVSRNDLDGFQSPAVVFRTFTEMLDRYVDRYDRRDKFFFVGYNAGFDADHLRTWFEKNGDKYFGSWFFHPPLDVMAIAAVILMGKRSDMENFKLPTVAKVLGFDVDDDKTHDALYDVLLTRDLFQHLMKEFRVA